jgi:stress response protein YsnF
MAASAFGLDYLVTLCAGRRHKQNNNASTSPKSTQIDKSSTEEYKTQGQFEALPEQEDYFMPKRKEQASKEGTRVQQQKITVRKALIANKSQMQLKLPVERKKRQVRQECASVYN